MDIVAGFAGVLSMGAAVYLFYVLLKGGDGR